MALLNKDMKMYWKLVTEGTFIKNVDLGLSKSL